MKPVMFFLVLAAPLFGQGCLDSAPVSKYLRMSELKIVFTAQVIDVLEMLKQRNLHRTISTVNIKEIFWDDRNLKNTGLVKLYGTFDKGYNSTDFVQGNTYLIFAYEEAGGLWLKNSDSNLPHMPGITEKILLTSPCMGTVKLGTDKSDKGQKRLEELKAELRRLTQDYIPPKK